MLLFRMYVVWDLVKLYLLKAIFDVNKLLKPACTDDLKSVIAYPPELHYDLSNGLI